MHWIERVAPQINSIWVGQTPPGWTEPARRLYDHELIVVTGGACEVQFPDETLILRESDYVIVPPDVLHTSRAPDGVHRYVFYFDWTPVDGPPPPGRCVMHPGRMPKARVRVAPDGAPAGVLHGTAAEWDAVAELLGQVRLRQAHWGAHGAAAVRPVLLDVLTHLFLAPAAEASPPRRLASVVRDRLERHLGDDVSLPQVLEALGYSYPHLCRVFRQAYGAPPLAYLNALRIERAKAYLPRPEYNVAQVAAMLGFRSQSYFTRLFKKYTGQTPRQYKG